MGDENTVIRTLWTDTLLEMLVVALERKPEPEVVELLREIRRKRFTREAVTAYVDKRLGDDGRRRLNACLGRIGA
ncbi:MAG: hypothetical protein H6977_12760 [Gammaproteobacteria bacterium]|nr:hypothetical protein [Gammaproteobacteria bacterium]MCP5200878.1 hypothetical protein [Gammaproteobacteria bacterium]